MLFIVGAKIQTVNEFNPRFQECSLEAIASVEAVKLRLQIVQVNLNEDWKMLEQFKKPYFQPFNVSKYFFVHHIRINRKNKS